MSQENVELVWSAFDAWNREDMESLLSLMDAEIVVVQPPMPDGGTFHGHAAVLEAIAAWPEQWDDFRVDVVQVVDVGGDRVLVRTHQCGRSKGSGIEVAEDFWFVFRFRDAKIAEWRIFDAEHQAHEAVGLSE